MTQSNFKPLPQSVFISEDVCTIAQVLLGKYLVSTIDNKFCVAKIVETEAYQAPKDKGSHAYGNKLTDRTKTMFKNGGRSYIYLCYGIHNMFNVVTAKKGTPHAILIRAVEPIIGVDHMLARRKTKGLKNLSNGPGKLCMALGITRKHNDQELFQKDHSIFIAENENVPDENVYKGPRVGIAYAEECANWPYRFYIKNNECVSLPKFVKY